MQCGWVGWVGLGMGVVLPLLPLPPPPPPPGGYRRQQKPPLPLCKQALLQALDAVLETSSTPSAHRHPAHKHSPAAPVG